jgi:hypothetical protein
MKNTKTTEVKKDRNLKGKLAGLYSLVVALAELATAYVFVTQDNKVLLPIAVVVGVDSAYRLASKFMR